MRYDPSALDSYLNAFRTKTLISTKTTARLHVLRCHNRVARVNDLARYVASTVLDYVVPRSKLNRVMTASARSTSPIVQLQQQARSLFSSAWRSGEGGEALLYLLTESILGIPQVLCKMPLKTSSAMHVHGSDGIHATVGSDNRLMLYWGESKLHATFASAVRDCFSSLAPMLCSSGGTHSVLERDLQLLRDNIDLNDHRLEAALQAYLDPDSKLFLKTSYCGSCLIGFDYDPYPDDIPDEFIRTAETWIEKIGTVVSEHNLTSCTLEVFCIPFPSVEEYRLTFLRELGIEPTAQQNAKDTTRKTASSKKKSSSTRSDTARAQTVEDSPKASASPKATSSASATKKPKSSSRKIKAKQRG